ncbi:hypothetical protein FACS189459_2000 [Bacilli bacterium]|nr:hypothetical protein FACS189459_2000 [Bacilli bacterium]
MFTKDIKNSLSVQKIVVEIIKQFYPDITTDQEALDEYYQKLNKLSDYEYIEYDMDPDMKLRTVPIYENNY